MRYKLNRKFGRCRRMVVLTAMLVFGAVSVNSSDCLAGVGASGGRNVLSQGFGVRALSMGGAYVSLANDADATFWNPAWLARLDRQAFNATHARFFQDTEINSASWGHNFDNLGALGVSFTRLGLDDFSAVNNWVVSPQQIGYSTSLASLSYARSVGEYFSFGITGKALYESLFGSQDYGFGLDLGFGARKDYLRAGVVIRDFVSSDINVGATGESQLRSTQFGLALDSVRLSSQLRATVSAEVELVENRSPIGRFGAEALLYNRLALRGGVDDGSATFGAGFVFDVVRIDYGFRVLSDIGDTHLFGFSLLFGSTAKERASRRQAERETFGEEFASADRYKRARESYDSAIDFEAAGSLDSALVYFQLSQSLDGQASEAATHILSIENQLRELALADSLAIVESAGLDSLSLAELASQLAVGLAEELRAEKRFVSALRVLDKARLADPDSPDVQSAIGRIIDDRDQWQVSQKDKAKKARLAGDFVTALDVYSELLREFPHDAQVRGALKSMCSKLKVSDLLSKAGRKLDSELYSEAKVYVERALVIDSTNSAAQGLLERILRSISPDESIRALSDNTEDWAKMSQALTLVREGKLEQALELFGELLVKYPHNSELLRNIEQVELRLSGGQNK
ncbi:hypothetical protein JYU19_01075 [bacterium AH-315-J21]|nr:hypothetical protein [bacterium AH-315-J21]